MIITMTNTVVTNNNNIKREIQTRRSGIVLVDSKEEQCVIIDS